MRQFRPGVVQYNPHTMGPCQWVPELNSVVHFTCEQLTVEDGTTPQDVPDEVGFGEAV